jgi:hypothetical protein
VEKRAIFTPVLADSATFSRFDLRVMENFADPTNLWGR